MGRQPKNEYASLARIARAHIKRAELLGKSLDARATLKREVSDMWTPDEDWRRDFASVTTSIQHATNSLVRSLESNKKNLGSLTEAQLEAQFNAEIVSAATSLTDDQWARMVDARRKAGRAV
jgi:hypothetical protein